MDLPHDSTTSSDTEIITTRIFDFHQDLVFKAWTDPQHLKNWWRPKGFTNTFHEFDLRPGGKWLFTMHSPDKGNHENACEFTQIVEPELIMWKRLTAPFFQVIATFSERPGHKTELTFKMLFDSAKECDKIRSLATTANEESFDRLEEELRQMNF